MKIYIDDKIVDTDSSTMVSVSLGIASLTDIEKARTGYSKTIILPITSRNRAIIGDADEPNAITIFNRVEHTARIEQDGFTILEGTPCLASCENGGNGSGFYKINIIGPGKEWARYAAATMLKSLPLDFSLTISAQGVENSWVWDKPVRFLPVQRDKFDVENPSSNLFPPVKILSFEDYHPFIHVGTLLRCIFAQTGYTLESTFFSSDHFNSLYISGNYPKNNVESIRSLVDFMAGRFNAAEAVADIYGRIYANPVQNISSIGNIADTADPTESYAGKTIDNVYSNGGYFTKENGRIVFAPPVEVTVGFEYKLFYTTDYYMKSRDRLSGFDIVNLGDGIDRQVNIANRNVDRRAELRANRDYMAIIFDYDSSKTYQLRYDEVINPAANLDDIKPSDVITRTYATYSSRVRSLSIAATKKILNPRMYEKSGSTSQYIECKSDWALYDGYVEERGTKEIELTIRSSVEKILPSRPKYFDMISFAGAEPGMKFVIGQKTTVGPVFAEYPGESTSVRFKQVAAHDITCIDFISALKNMFNLWFYTDNLAKKVIVEPRESFYRDEPVVDWSDKIDYGKSITIEELGTEMPRMVTFRYNTEDGAVARWNSSNQQTLGKWSAEINNRFAKVDETTYTNLFCPSLNVSGSFPDAPAASLLQAGNREHSAVRGEDLNFPVKIVRYLGLKSLPKGQHWGWPSGGTRYPFLAFHHKNPLTLPESNENQSSEDLNSGFSLCFEDRNGIQGLHRYWDKNITLYNEGKRLSLYLRLEPQDVEPLISPNSLACDFRARFKLDINGETGIYRLEQVCDYNPAKRNSTKCIFIKDI